MVRFCVIFSIFLASSGALSLDHSKRSNPLAVHSPRPTTTTLLLLTTRGGSDVHSNDVDRRREIKVSTSLEVPFDALIAFDAFSDLPRQAEFSPWLRKVEYIVPPDNTHDRVGRNLGETKWYMGFRGVSFTWNAISTKLERPRLIEWESTSGMKNYGRVDFERKDENSTIMTLTMTFVAPRIVAGLFRRSSIMANFVQNQILRSTLENFRTVMMEKDLAGCPPLNQNDSCSAA
jgi:uncharacterized membrane protein